MAATPGTSTATAGPEAKRTPAANGAGRAGPVASDRPPASAAGGSGRPRGRPSKADKRAETVERLTKRFTRWSMLLMLLDDATAVAVLRHSPDIAESAADVAERYPWAAKLLDGAASGGALLGFGASVGVCALEVCANKDLLPEPFNTMLKTPEKDRQPAAAAPEPAPEPAAAPTEPAAPARSLADVLAGLRS